MFDSSLSESLELGGGGQSSRTEDLVAFNKEASLF